MSILSSIFSNILIDRLVYSTDTLSCYAEEAGDAGDLAFILVVTLNTLVYFCSLPWSAIEAGP